MIFVWLGLLFGVASAVCWSFIVIHAFRRSVGTGVMVLFVPCFIFYYAFVHFEHPWKGLIVSGFIASLVLCVVLPSVNGGGLLLTRDAGQTRARGF